MTESILRTSEFKWDPVNQVRCGVSVDSVTRLFAENPFEVVSMDLSEWKLEDQGGRAAVVHCDGIPNGFHWHRIPETLEGTLPVIVGIGNSRKFIIDGAHRIAKALVENRKTIWAVVLSEEQTRQCVRTGQMARFDRETG
jgi:hypothetical protein